MRHAFVAFALLAGACACGAEDMQGDAAEPQRIKVGEGKYEPQAGSAAVGVATEALNGACSGGVTKEKARLSCASWSDQGSAMYGFNCGGNPNVSYSFTVQGGAPSGKNWYHVYKRTTHPGSPVDETYAHLRYDQCSCNDASPCSAISALAAPKEAEAEALPSDGAGAGVTATCTASAYCSKARSTIASYLGGSWSWSGSCSSQTWNATGSGGRTLQAKYITLAPGNPLYQHSVWASQTANFQNICSCSNGNVSCSNNPGF